MMDISASNAVPRPIELPASLPRRSTQNIRRRYESESARLLLRANGLDDIDRLFALADRSLHGHKGRAVSRVELTQPGGNVVSAYVKLNWGRSRMIPRTTDLKTGQAFQNFPFREWQGIAELRSLGLLVPQRLAWLQRGRFWFQEAVVIKSVRPPFSVDDLIREGRWAEFSRDDRQEILQGVVAVMQRIHDAGFGWRGTCTRHFFPEKPSNGAWQFWLIDCEGIHRRLTAKNVTRDYRKLNRALAISGADAATLDEFRQLTDRAERAHAHRRSRRKSKEPAPGLNSAIKPSM